MTTPEPMSSQRYPARIEAAHQAVEMSKGMPPRLRAFVHIDKLQPQYAAVVGSISMGTPPIQGMSGCMIEVAPSILIVQLADRILKTCDVTVGTQEMERTYGTLSFHSREQDNIREAAQVALDYLGITKTDRERPTLNDIQIVHNVHPRQAQVVNANNIGGLLLAGQSLLVLECQPAAYIAYLANEVEKATDITLIRMEAIGAHGRLWVAGSEAEIMAAQDTAMAALAYLQSASSEPGRAPME